jgi:hypothetical protein
MRVPFFTKCPPKQQRKKILSNYTKTRGMPHCGLAIYILKVSEGKRSIMEIQNISPCKHISSKKSSKRYQNPSRYHNSIITNLKFQHKPKYHLPKILI